VAKSQNFNLQRCARSKPRSDTDNRREKRNKRGRGRPTRALDKINHFKLNENIGRDELAHSNSPRLELRMSTEPNSFYPFTIPSAKNRNDTSTQTYHEMKHPAVAV